MSPPAETNKRVDCAAPNGDAGEIVMLYIKESQSESASARKSALLGVSIFASLDMLASNERRLRETKASRKSLICRR